jgi:hypothetical protein
MTNNLSLIDLFIVSKYVILQEELKKMCRYLPVKDEGQTKQVKIPFEYNFIKEEKICP